MNRLFVARTIFLVAILVPSFTGFAAGQAFWSQWGRNAQHQGMVNIAGQPLDSKLADIVYDPFTLQEQIESGGELLAHYQSTLIDGNSFYMVQKSGSYHSCHPAGLWEYGLPCGPNAWNQVQWNVVRYDWQQNTPVVVWTYPTDWKPEPNDTNLVLGFVGLGGWEPVFHPALANGFLYVPGAAGTIWKVNTTTGQTQAHINPFPGASMSAANTFVSSPLTADDSGNIYYNVIELNINGNPWDQNDVAGAWLVKVTATDSAATVAYATLVPNAPPGNSTQCEGTFFNLPNSGSELPWPPPGIALPPTQLCGSQRPGINIAPAVAPDGTVYTVSVAHFDSQVAYMIAVNPDLTPKWASSLQYRLTDGCGVLLPIAPRGVNNEPNSCRFGTRVGVDPTTDAPGSGSVIDQSSSTPTVLPDGSVLFGATDNYNYSRGHLFHFDAQGHFLNAYTFGWDSTAGVYQHGGTYSVVIKDNHYPSPAYCFFNNPVCTPVPAGPYLVSQLDTNLQAEWSFQNTTIDSQHPNGYEWCVNAPVIDVNGLVYITSEDGNIYSVPQGHHGIFTQWQQRIFLLEALGAAYTPLSIGDDGKVYSQNDGNLFVVGQ
ncbi:MAG TPA: hypothetical protein VL240_11560 [Candidatus Binatia bacterium]|nr:hypothetical protein [Candidatus Binatia bacterium]